MKTDTQEKSEETVDPSLLEKSWDSSMEELRKSLTSGDKKKVLDKAKKEKEYEDDDEEMEDEEDEEDETDEDEKKTITKKIKKSLPDIIAEDDPESEAAMDIEPYLKSLAESIDQVIEDRTLVLEKAIKGLTNLVKVQGKALLANMELQKSLDDKIKKIGESPIPPASTLRKSGNGRFTIKEGMPEMTKDQVMMKAMKLTREGLMDNHQLTILEGRLNKGMEIPTDIQLLLEGGK
jgi:hypothetical protein